jgi:hypothetical protein
MRRALLLAALPLWLAGCGGGESSASAPSSAATTSADSTSTTAAYSARIYHSPYANVSWGSTLRIKAQHHDHPGTSLASLLAYDAAGYNALSLMDYSGAPALSYALRRRLWTPEEVGVSTALRNSFRNLALLIPNAEEVGEGAYHMTSPFLTSYIQKYTPTTSSQTMQDSEYSSPQQLIDLIASKGGVPILAHPWNAPETYTALRNYRGMEIYSAYSSVMTRRGYSIWAGADKNASMQAFWDTQLATNQRIVGLAVNDHFGPDAALSTVDPDLRDSGKIIVFAPSYDLASYRSAFEAGALLAVQDLGTIKDRYPVLQSLAISSTALTLDTDGTVRWISMGAEIGSGKSLSYSAIPRGATYVRAEIANSEGSKLFTQAFVVRQEGDNNGDGTVNAADAVVCQNVTAGTDTDADHVRACRP